MLKWIGWQSYTGNIWTYVAHLHFLFPHRQVHGVCGSLDNGYPDGTNTPPTKHTLTRTQEHIGRINMQISICLTTAQSVRPINPCRYTISCEYLSGLEEDYQWVTLWQHGAMPHQQNALGAAICQKHKTMSSLAHIQEQ